MKSRLSTSGFTLIEVMIVVVIVAVLAAVALPAYENHVLKARRSVAQSFISQVALKEEEYFSHMRSYGAYDSATATDAIRVGNRPPEITDFYQVAVCTATANCAAMTNFPTNGYVVIATRISTSAQRKDAVGEVALYSNGRKCTTARVDEKWGNQTC